MKPNRSLFSALFLSNFVLALVLLLGLGWYTLNALQGVYRSAWVHHLEQSLDFTNGRLQSLAEGPAHDSLLTQEFHLFRHAMQVRVTLMDLSGRVLFDSDTAADVMQNHLDRPEVQDALHDGQGVATRYSATVSKTMLYVARKVQLGSQTQILRASTPIHGIEEEVVQVYRKWAEAVALAILLGAVLAYLVSKRVVAPINALRAGAERFAEGNFDRKLPVSSLQELHSLADSMNRMAAQLDDRMRRLALQRNETEAILSSLVEGVVALDHTSTILRSNHAFENLLGLKDRTVVGRKLLEVVRNSELDSMLREFGAGNHSLTRDITLVESDGARTLMVRGSVLLDIQGNDIGVLLVLNDVTRIRKLEDMRSDFVANVSHELKTPITSIKGYVETLQEMPVASDPDALRFLDIVARHADRLNSIVDDLLTLSRIEQDARSFEAEFQPIELADLVDSVVQFVEPIAQKKQVKIISKVDPGIVVQGNPGLLEQALVNLVSNACKYSEDGKIVEVIAIAGAEVRILVKDQGFGIERRHLPRIFERFYRVDKARSRNLGGTGLGLAIAKHIALLHHGKIQVESDVGVGSTFTLTVPAALTVS